MTTGMGRIAIALALAAGMFGCDLERVVTLDGSADGPPADAAGDVPAATEPDIRPVGDAEPVDASASDGMPVDAFIPIDAILDGGSSIDATVADAAAGEADAGSGEPGVTGRAVVIDRAGLPITGATIEVGAERVVTDDGGWVELPRLAGSVVVRASAPGFAPAAQRIDADQSADVLFTLLALSPPVVFDPGEGVDTTIDGVRVEVPPGVVVDADGAPVVGPVALTVTPVDPTRPDAVLPGPQLGLDPAIGADPVLLVSVFMAEVSLWQGDTTLHVGDGEAVTLTLPIPPVWRDRLVIGDAVPAWWLDETRAVWVRDGAGEVVDTPAGPAWRAEVSHLTWWNVDKPAEFINCHRVRVVDADGAPAPGAWVLADAPDWGIFTLVRADDRAEACLLTLGGEEMGLTARDGDRVSERVVVPIEMPADGMMRACGEDECEAVELVLAEPACLVVAVREADGVEAAGVLIVEPGQPPGEVDLGMAESCWPIPLGAAVDIVPVEDGQPDRAGARRVVADTGSTCDTPADCVRVVFDPAPPLPRDRLMLGEGTLCRLEQGRGGACFGSLDGTPPPRQLGPGTTALAADGLVCVADRGGAVRCVGRAAERPVWPDVDGGRIDAWRGVHWASPAIDFGIGRRMICALGRDLLVRCRDGLEEGDLIARPLLRPDLAPVFGVRRMSTGRMNMCAIDGAGEVYCRRRGALAAEHVELPVPALEIVASNSISCALLATREVWCWGRPAYGARGPDFDPQDFGPGPVLVGPDIPLADAQTLDLGADADSVVACVTDSRGEVRCWGEGALGRETGLIGMAQQPYGHYAEPVDWQDFDPHPPARAVVTDAERTCAAFVDGTAVCWGEPLMQPIADFAPRTPHGRPAARRIRPRADEVFDLNDLGDL